jgi:hypothetical protein
MSDLFNRGSSSELDGKIPYPGQTHHLGPDSALFSAAGAVVAFRAGAAGAPRCGACGIQRPSFLAGERRDRRHRRQDDVPAPSQQPLGQHRREARNQSARPDYAPTQPRRQLRDGSALLVVVPHSALPLPATWSKREVCSQDLASQPTGFWSAPFASSALVEDRG